MSAPRPGVCHVCFHERVVCPEGVNFTDMLAWIWEERVLGRRVGWTSSKFWQQLYFCSFSERMIFHPNVLLLPKRFTRRYPPRRTTHWPLPIPTTAATGAATPKCTETRSPSATLVTCASPSPSIRATPAFRPSMPTAAIWPQPRRRPWQWRPAEGHHRRPCPRAMVLWAGRPGLRPCHHCTHTPTPSARPRWSASALSPSWCQPRVGPGPWYRMPAEGMCRKKAKDALVPGGGWGGRAGKDNFLTVILVKSTKEEAVLWPGH